MQESDDDDSFSQDSFSKKAEQDIKNLQKSANQLKMKQKLLQQENQL